MIREASSLYYSRLRVDSNQTGAKAYMIYLIREARHMKLALELDTLKFTSIDLDIRILCDYTYFKGQGYLGFPDDLRFLYGYFKPGFVRNMHPSQFIILSRKGTIGVGWFPEVKWHKQERENLLKILDMTVEPNEGMIEGEDYGSYKTVGDKQHMRMVEAVAPKRLRALRGLDTEKRSYRGVAGELGHSPSTVTMHVAKHDSAVTSMAAVVSAGGLGEYSSRTRSKVEVNLVKPLVCTLFDTHCIKHNRDSPRFMCTVT